MSESVQVVEYAPLGFEVLPSGAAAFAGWHPSFPQAAQGQA